MRMMVSSVLVRLCVPLNIFTPTTYATLNHFGSVHNLFHKVVFIFNVDLGVSLLLYEVSYADPGVSVLPSSVGRPSKL